MGSGKRVLGRARLCVVETRREVESMYVFLNRRSGE